MASAEEPAQYRFRFTDSREIGPVVLEGHTSAVSQATKTPSGATYTALQPLRGPPAKLVTEGSRIVLEAKSDAADNIEDEESNLWLPVILTHKGTGAKQNALLTFERDMVGFGIDSTGAASADDVALVTDKFTKVGHIVKPEGFILQLDYGAKWHLYFGDDTV